ncbi:GntR family transcriptional regulator [Caulobacter endophyticus]|uniref:GntR family transcriptional regulator n=1 Tax=Caulobacter endophyticus TaxID=2172652 RepID=UPI00240EB78C|nr:GntR family transcriptional regulator [Caulobacter endophyticus]MDG2528239.1 GntR family transcriptional regulator [Caulobacter endophyticus]
MIDRPGTGERVYLSIKTFLLSESALRPGERIDVPELSRRFGASATPVRAALHRLVGERLLTALPGEGFLVPRLTEPDLSDLYQWNVALLVNAARSAGGEPAISPEAPEGDGPIAALEDLFARLAARSGNVEVEWAVAGASDRLHRPRCAELELVPEFQEETRELRGLAAAGSSTALRQALVAYHRRRLRLVPAIVRSLHGLSDRDPRRPAE